MKMRLFIGVAVGVMCGAATAQAVPIDIGSELSLNGSNTATATSISFFNPGNIGGESGSFTALNNCSGCVVLTSFDSTTSDFLLYKATEGGIASTLTTIGAPTFTVTPGVPLSSLSITGNGTLTLTGFDPTPGAYEITTQGGVLGELTFSSTAVAEAVVSEPNPLAVLGIALLGFWGARRFWRRGEDAAAV